jgi:hypothetical protein
LNAGYVREIGGLGLPDLTADHLVHYGIHNLLIGDAFAAGEKYGKQLTAEQLAQIALGIE